MKNKPVVADESARIQALDVSSSFIVQAPAGSGKTGLLTQRVLSLLVHADEPEEILAITFTHKAAGEMRNRILESLERACDDAPPERSHDRQTWSIAKKVLERSRQRRWDILQNASRLQVQTIDSLCASLTRQMPILSAFGTQPAISEDAERLYSEAARALLAEIENGQTWSPKIEQLLTHLDNNLYRVEQLLADMLANRDHWLRYLGDRQGEHLRRHTLESALHRIIEEHLQELASRVPAHLEGEIVSLASIAARNLGDINADSPILACKDIKNLPGHQVAHLVVWQALAQLFLTGGNWRKAVNKNIGFPTSDKAGKQRMKELLVALQGEEPFRQQLAGVSNLPGPGYTEQQWRILDALIELLPTAVGHLKVVFNTHGQVDFTEVAQRAVQSLGGHENPTDLALALDYRIHHILVDEFQDTSLSQYQLLERLTTGWSEGDGRTMFLVGDPMQSIYRFREADVALYLRARKQGIGTVSLKPLTLSVNFRSQTSLVTWFNRAFTEIFPKTEDLTSGAVAYTEARSHIPELEGEAVVIEPLVDEGPATEAKKVVAVVEQQLANHPDESIAILVRARSHLQSIVRSLANAGINFRAVEIEHLADRQAVIDLMSLTRALMHLGDRVAWIAILRAPWCGLGLADLEALIGSHPELPVWQIVVEGANQAELSVDGQQRLSQIAGVLKSALELRGTLPLSEWVEGTWRWLAGPAVLPHEKDLSDCEQYFALLRSMESQSIPTTISRLQEKVEQLFASTDPASDERLQVMTIHKSKGLEFDTVILPGLGRRSPPNKPRLLNWTERTVTDDRSELILAPIPASSEDRDSINGYLRYLDREREENETSRLLYVAATRAKRRLFLFGEVNSRPEGESVVVQPPTTGSLLSTLWPAVSHNFVDAAPSDKQYGEPMVEGGPGQTWLDVQGIQRLQSNALNVMQFEPLPTRHTAIDESPVEFSWVGPAARHVGTVVHKLFESLVNLGIEYASVLDSEVGRANIRTELASLGVGYGDLDTSVETVVRAINNVLQDKRGLWILDGRHRDSRCEYALESIDENHNYFTSIIDRTFIDDDDNRWIIDYKTSSHSGGGTTEFLDREMERYQPQLNRYAKVTSQIENRPIKLGLYFPLLSGWRSWDFNPN